MPSRSGHTPVLTGPDLDAQRAALRALAIAEGLAPDQYGWQAALARKIGVSRARISGAWAGKKVRVETMAEWGR